MQSNLSSYYDWLYKKVCINCVQMLIKKLNSFSDLILCYSCVCVHVRVCVCMDVSSPEVGVFLKAHRAAFPEQSNSKVAVLL